MKNKTLEKHWRYVADVANQYGYECWNHNDSLQGIGATIYKEDKFVPIINLNIEPELIIDKRVVITAKMFFLIQDRNGNDILTGKTCAVHSLEDCEDFEIRLKEMCKYVFNKYSQYSRENRLDFAFNEYKEERMEWNNIDIKGVKGDN